MTIVVTGPLGKPVKKPALRVTFPHDQRIEEPVGLVGIGSDLRCHVLLPADVVSPVHCRVYAQLNSGPRVWIVDDSSVGGTQIQDDESSGNKVGRTVHGRRQGAQGLKTIQIGLYSFQIRVPVSETEIRRREDWFSINQPIPVTREMLDRQLGGLDHDWHEMHQVGEGGNGKVYKYMERNTALFVAVKEEKARNKEHEALILKEINFMKTLRHVRFARNKW